MSALLMKLIETARHFNMTLQPNLLLLQKSMVIIEGVGRQLYPDIDMWAVAKPLIYKWMMREKFSPKAVYERASLGAEELAGAALELPLNANGILKRVLNDELKIGFAHHGMDEIADGLDNAGRRIGGGVVLASVIISATIAGVFSTEDSVRVLGLPLLSVIGFVVAFIIAIRLWGIPLVRRKEE
jgi:ubiquinone biosynthesis protein